MARSVGAHLRSSRLPVRLHGPVPLEIFEAVGLPFALTDRDDAGALVPLAGSERMGKELPELEAGIVGHDRMAADTSWHSAGVGVDKRESGTPAATGVYARRPAVSSKLEMWLAV